MYICMQITSGKFYIYHRGGGGRRRYLDDANPNIAAPRINQTQILHAAGELLLFFGVYLILANPMLLVDSF
jgi:hypothetical protein